jgi:hypothetical protein
LNLTCMWLMLHLLAWRNLRWVRCNDVTYSTQVPAHVFLLINCRMHFSKNKISPCILSFFFWRVFSFSKPIGETIAGKSQITNNHFLWWFLLSFFTVIKWWLKPYLRDPSKSMAHHLRDANSNAIFEPHNSEKFHIMSINVGWWFWLLRARKDILTSCWTSQGALWPRYALVPISNYYYIIIKVYETWEFDRDCVSSFVLPSCLMQPSR